MAAFTGDDVQYFQNAMQPACAAKTAVVFPETVACFATAQGDPLQECGGAIMQDFAGPAKAIFNQMQQTGHNPPLFCGNYDNGPIDDLMSCYEENFAQSDCSDAPQCECAPEWHYGDVTYQGCDDRKPDENQTWCRIKGNSKVCKPPNGEQNRVGSQPDSEGIRHNWMYCQ